MSKNKNNKTRRFLAINKPILKNLTLLNSKSMRISTLSGQIPIDTMSLDVFAKLQIFMSNRSQDKWGQSFSFDRK
jgi:hypothetical protein